VHRETTSIFAQNKVIVRETKRAVTPYGGLAVFVEYLRKIGYSETIHRHMPVCLNSPNAIDTTETFTAFLISVISGARRFAHAIGARRWAQNRFQKPSFQVRMPPNSMKGVIFNPEVYISHILSEVYEAAAGRMHNRPAAYVSYPYLHSIVLNDVYYVDDKQQIRFQRLPLPSDTEAAV